MIERTSRVVFLGVLAVAFCAGPALATPQWSPTTGTERAHTVESGAVGIEWDTSGVGAGGQIVYDSATGIVTVTGIVDVLNYWDAANGGCPTDTAGSTCSYNYAPDLDLSVTAEYVGYTTEVVAGDFVNVYLNFQTTGGAYDLQATDPSDGDSIMLTGSFVSGEYNGDPTTGLSTKILYNTATHDAIWESIDVPGFLAVDETTLHASLFEDSYIGLALTEVTSFDDGDSGGLDEIVAELLATDVLPDFTAEADGQAFSVAGGAFIIPEPSTALLLGLGLTLMGALRRRRS